MRISDRYIGKQVLLGTLSAVVVLGIVLVFGSLFKDIDKLLVEQKAPLGLILRFALNVLPSTLTYTVPWGFLTAVLMVFSRLSLHQEITSFRVAGVSLVRLAAPVFAVGLTLSGLSLWLNTRVVPMSKATLKELIYEQATRDPKSLLKPGVIIGDFRSDSGDTQKLLIESKNGDAVGGFHLYVTSKPDPKQPLELGKMTYIHAVRAALAVDTAKSQLRIRLEDAYMESRNEKGETETSSFQTAEPLVIDLKATKSSQKKPNTMSNEEIRAALAENDSPSKKRRYQLETQITWRYAFSMSCFAFAFVAVPLGLQSRRRDSSGGMVASLAIGTAYFLLMMFAEQAKSVEAARMILWTPNVLCILLGLFLFRRARFK